MRILLIEDDKKLSFAITEQLQKKATLQTVATMGKQPCITL